MQRHKSLLAWKCAHEVVSGVYDSSFRPSHPSSYPVYDQLRRAALSVQLNIAEGYALQSPRAFRRHLNIAYGSAVETGDLLELLVEKQLGPTSRVQVLLDWNRRAQGLLLGLLNRYRPTT